MRVRKVSRAFDTFSRGLEFISDLYLKISFTASVGTGKKIQVAAANSNFKRVTLELGKPTSIWPEIRSS